MSNYTAEGVRLIPDSTELQKDINKGHVGLAIGGGAPVCNSIYVVQVFENSPCALDGKIGVGDEIVAINGVNIRGFEKAAVADLIRKSQSPVRISFNRIQVDPEKGKTLDILFKKIKHWVVESIEPKTADALGLSRAVLCNDLLQKLLERLDSNENFYKQLHQKLIRLIRCYGSMSSINNELGALFGQVAVRELSPESVNFFTQYADTQSAIFKETSQFVSNVERLIDSIQSYVKNAIPDVRLSLSKYMNAKFEYLSYCLKIKEMEDEEVEMAEYDEYPQRMETGNYEYRVMLKCRETSRAKFIEMRNHVQIKIQLLDEKQISDLPQQLRMLISAMAQVNKNNKNILRNAIGGIYKGVQVDSSTINGEINGIMKHLGIDSEKRQMLIVEDPIDETVEKKRQLSISHWRDTRIRSTWPPDDIGEEAIADDEQEVDDHDVQALHVVEQNLIDLDFDDKSEPAWPSNWDNLLEETEKNALKDLIPEEWLSSSNKKDEQSSGTALSGLQIEPELLQQFRSAEAELLLQFKSIEGEISGDHTHQIHSLN
uniref:PRKCA-binding protein n=1 Tax=Panagrolaimus sp. JU765 TaxID=591449 RepID=A0AC34REK5_9BILA